MNLVQAKIANTPFYYTGNARELWPAQEILGDDAYRTYDYFQNNVVNSVLDLGCHFGYFGLHVRNTFPEARIWCVDASSTAIRVARANLGEERSTFLQTALGWDTGTVRLKQRMGEDSVCTQHADGLGQEMEDKPRHLESTVEEVPRDSIITILSRWNWPQIDLLKIDIEGGEIAVLNHLRQKGIHYLRTIPYIVGEFHGFKAERCIYRCLSHTHLVDAEVLHKPLNQGYFFARLDKELL